jgi:hypothetical protein
MEQCLSEPEEHGWHGELLSGPRETWAKRYGTVTDFDGPEEESILQFH